MSRARTIAALVALCLAAAGAAHAQDAKGEPFELVRALQSLQDQVVQGNARAHAAQRVLLGRIAEQFEALGAERWKDARNVRAAVVFVLSGGTVRALQKLMASGAGTALDEKLVKGSIAYGEGRLEEAADLLAGVDARALDPGMAGHVAYVQGELVAKKEPAKALAYLDDARLLSPGTIIEEAALRREIGLLAAMGNADRYEALATQYLRRFSASVYAGGFRQQFAVAIAVHTDAAEPGRLERLAVMLAGVDGSDRRDVYLMIAKEAVGKGKVKMAKFAAVNAGRLTEDGSAERERARLYEAAALIATDDFERGAAMLAAAERGKLVEADIALLDSALAVAAQVRRLPDPPEPGSAPPAASSAAGDSANQMLESARKSIAQVDAMLGEAGR